MSYIRYTRSGEEDISWFGEASMEWRTAGNSIPMDAQV